MRKDETLKKTLLCWVSLHTGMHVNLILDRGIYIYHQNKHIPQSYSTLDMQAQFITVFCFHLLNPLVSK